MNPGDGGRNDRPDADDPPEGDAPDAPTDPGGDPPDDDPPADHSDDDADGGTDPSSTGDVQDGSSADGDRAGSHVLDGGDVAAREEARSADGLDRAADAGDAGASPTPAPSPAPSSSAAADVDPDADSDAPRSPLVRLRTDEEGPYRFVREVLLNVGAVVLVGLLLFAVSGVWPPMVAVESGSMEPHMYRGDLVLITEPGRFVPDAAERGTGVVTYEAGRTAGYRSFGDYGSVVVYDNPRRGGPPVIHRAHFYVEAGENWYPRANPDYLAADSCAELDSCPAGQAGYITKGDANANYDQANGISGPVKPEWITGVARVRIPLLGWVRLALSWVSGPVPPVEFAATLPEALPTVDVAAAGTPEPVGAGADGVVSGTTGLRPG